MKKNNRTEWVIELEHLSFGCWKYAAYQAHYGDGLPSAICLSGLAFSRKGALKKAKKDIAELNKVTERIYVNG